MVQDPLSALGARLEARLHAQSARLRSVEDTVRAQVEANRPAEFTLLPDGTKQFGYAPVYAEAASTPAASEIEAEESIGESFSSAVQDEVKAQFIALAPASRGEASKPQVMADSASTPDDVAAPSPAQIAAAESLPVIISPVSPVDVEPVAAQSAAAPTADAASAITAESASGQAQAAPSAAAANVASANTSDSGGWVMLPDGTKQFGYAPTGPVVNVRNLTPPVPADFGAGATFRIHGLNASTPMTVTRAGDGVVFAMYTDSEGTREMAFMPNQLDLVTAAPN